MRCFIKMAQHYPIKSWINESWYPKMIKEIQNIVSKTKGNKGKEDPRCKGFYIINTNTQVLPDDYKIDKQDHRVLNYKPRKSSYGHKRWEMRIDNENPHIKVNQCNFEIHLDRNNKINEVYVPL